MASRSSLRVLAWTSLVLILTAALPGTARAQSDSRGTDFWLAFLQNLGSPELTLFITGDTDTTGTVEVPGLGSTTPFSVTAGTVTSVVVPVGAALSGSDTVLNRGIHVTAGADVTVYGLNRVQFTTDAFLGLPTDILGTEYIVLGYENVNVVNATEFGIVAPEDDTTVTIVPSVTTGARTAGVPYDITLNQGEAYQLVNTNAAPADLSGTIVTSDKPIAVFGGHQCANIPSGQVACDHIVEALPPTTTWGRSFVTMPLATRLNGDTFRVLASTDGTTVSVNGTEVATLDRGQLHEQIIAGSATITSNNPVLVAQYSNGSSYDGVTSDPFMMIIPPYEQFLASYTVTTPASGFTGNYINVVAPSAAVGNITLDGTAIPAASFTQIGSSAFSGAQLPVALGAHTLVGSLPFGAFMYGFDSYDSYGYPGGLSLAPIAVVNSVSLSPEDATNPIGTDHCVVATVTDQNGAAVVGVRVDFSVTGVHSVVGFEDTDAGGLAEFCYGGTAPGTDTITASVGALSDTATKTWTSGEASCQADAAIDIEKLINGEDADSAPGPSIPVGSTLNWTFVVTNSGGVPLGGVIVSDDKLGAICTAPTLGPGASMTCTARSVASAGQQVNTAKAGGACKVNGKKRSVRDSDSAYYVGVVVPD